MMIQSTLPVVSSRTAITVRPIKSVRPVEPVSHPRRLRDDGGAPAVARGYARDYALPKGHLVDITA